MTCCWLFVDLVWCHIPHIIGTHLIQRDEHQVYSEFCVTPTKLLIANHAFEVI
jgi:hypothetical protein